MQPNGDTLMRRKLRQLQPSFGSYRTTKYSSVRCIDDYSPYQLDLAHHHTNRSYLHDVRHLPRCRAKPLHPKATLMVTPI